MKKNYYSIQAIFMLGLLFITGLMYGDNNRFPVRVGVKWGYIDNTGTMVIKPAFREAHEFSEGLAAVKIVHDWYFIDISGDKVITIKRPEYIIRNSDSTRDGEKVYGKITEVSEFHNGMAFFREETASGGNVSDTGHSYSYCFINTRGYKIFRTYVKPSIYSEDLAVITEEGLKDLFGYCDSRGKFVIKAKFKAAFPFSEGLAKVKMLDEVNWRFINKSGKKALHNEYLMANSFKEGYASVKLGKKWLFIDKKSVNIFAKEFDDAGTFSQGRAAVKIGKKWGYIDKKGKTAIKPEFDKVEEFSDGLAAVMIKRKWGYIDRKGKMVIEPQYSKAEPFDYDIARVKLKNKIYYIDKAGFFVWEGK